MNTLIKQQKNLPEVRFSNFTESWNKNKLKQLGRHIRGSGLAKSDVSLDGKNDCIRYAELYTIYNENITSVSSKTNLSKDSMVLSQKDDLIFPSSGETLLDIAKFSRLAISDVVLSGDLNAIRFKNGYNSLFFAYYLNNYKKKEIAKYAQGISIVHLYWSHFGNIEVSTPTLDEQQKIADFLDSVDVWLNNLRQQKIALETYKRGMMQKLFTQQVRFKDENGKHFPGWKTELLGKIARITTGSSNREGSTDSGKYRLFDRSNDERWSSDYELDAEVLIVAGEGLTFKPRHYSGKFALHQRAYAVINNGSDVNWRYLFYFITFNDHWFRRMAVGTTMPSLRMDAFTKMEIDLPNEQEQQKIANFLTALDESITAKAVEITKVEKWKKGLMQKMFV